jgi:hypothetical protein
MILSKWKIAATAVVTSVAAFLLLPQAGAADPGGNAFKMEGAWIARTVGVPSLQWTYIVAPDPSGRRATGHGTIDVGISLEPFLGPTDGTTPLMVNAVMTSNSTTAFNSVWYSVRHVSGGLVSSEIVAIGQATGQQRFLTPDRIEGTYLIAYYLPSQDADGDGLPDPGQEPIVALPFTTIETRVPAP